MRKATGRRLRWLSGGMGVAALVTLLMGVSPRSAMGFDDLITRSGRVAYVSGDVTILNAGSPDATAAQLNMPLVEGVRVETGDDGQAEVEFEDGSLIRMTPKSSVLLVRMVAGADGRYGTEMELTSGLIYANLRATAKYAYRIDVGHDYVTPLANATIRILLDQPPATVAVLDGTAHVERVGSQPDGGFQVDVERGESLRGDATGGSRYFLTQQIGENSWDEWNEEREQAALDASAARTSARDLYAGDQGYGWSDLDANGTWYDAGQGPIWQPYDASLTGFDPYGYGSWVWSGPSYVWTSGYVWGWTPFRCGRWNYFQDFGWGWIPSAGNNGGGLRAGNGVGIDRRRNTINLSNVPPGYQRPLPPVAGVPVRVHPIIPVRSGPAPTGERPEGSEGRQIAGSNAMPLRPLGGGYTPRGGSAVGSSLRRDFPVDRITRRPMMGAVTAPAKRDLGAAARRTGAAGGTADGAPGNAAAGAAVNPGRGSEGLANDGLVNQGLVNQGVVSQGWRADGLSTDVGRRRVHPGDAPATVGRPVTGAEGTRPTFPARTGALPPPGSSVAAPPPQPVHVHPGDRTDYRAGERSSERSSEGAGPVNRTSPVMQPPVMQQPPVLQRPPVMQQPPMMQRVMPSERSVPAPPPPMRSAPPPPAVRSSPAPAPAAAPSNTPSTPAVPKR